MKIEDVKQGSLWYANTHFFEFYFYIESFEGYKVKYTDFEIMPDNNRIIIRKMPRPHRIGTGEIMEGSKIADTQSKARLFKHLFEYKVEALNFF